MAIYLSYLHKSISKWLAGIRRFVVSESYYFPAISKPLLIKKKAFSNKIIKIEYPGIVTVIKNTINAEHISAGSANQMFIVYNYQWRVQNNLIITSSELHAAVQINFWKYLQIKLPWCCLDWLLSKVTKAIVVSIGP